MYFAEQLHWSMKGFGTDEKTLTRVMVSRCGIDLEDIKKTFLETYRKTLYSFIKVRERNHWTLQERNNTPEKNTGADPGVRPPPPPPPPSPRRFCLFLIQIALSMWLDQFRWTPPPPPFNLREKQKDK